MKLLAMAVALTTVGGAARGETAAPQLGKDPIKTVIASMTLEEKVALLVGEGRATGGPPGAGVVGQTEELVPGAAGTTHAVPRLGITPSVLADGPAGVRIRPTRPNDERTYYATAFPVGTLLASTWDVGLVEDVGRAMGNEVLEYGVDVLLGPGLNIHRNPLCGRNFEYYSEDPLVAGRMAAAIVRGIQSQGVGTAIKHFAANNAETARTVLDTKVSERALREIYLEGFRIAVQEGQPWTVMSSYNLINGTYASERADLLTTVLRGDWGFKGYVMSDWDGGRDPVGQEKAGNDELMPGRPRLREALLKAVGDGSLDVRVLDASVERVLTILTRTPRFKGYNFSNKPDLGAHAEITRRAAADGMVLLKNNSATLPLSQETKTVAAFGNGSYETLSGGLGSGDVNKAYMVSVAQGLGSSGYTVNPDLTTLYATYLKLAHQARPVGPRPTRQSIPELEVPGELLTGLASLADVAIITITRNSGEFIDRKDVEGDFKLTPWEHRLIQHVTTSFHAKGKKVVVVLNVAGTLETVSWRDQPDAILLAWEGGQETGNAVANILSGKVNPCGKIATTFVVDYQDVPSAKSFPGKEIPGAPEPEVVAGPSPFQKPKPSEITYDDGIYVGYRYYDTFGVRTAYEFGYGLSYTTFVYSNLKLSRPMFNSREVVSVEVKNTGAVAGREVVELYLAAPAKTLDKPAKELKGFAKTKLLSPGESETLSFTLDARSLTSFDPGLSAWVAEAGRYEVEIGASSRDVRQSAFFTVGKALVVKKEARALAPKEPIVELKPPPRP